MWLGVTAGVLALATAGVATLVAASGDAGSSGERLPDLVQRAPYQLVGQTAPSPRGPRFRIGFASAVDNRGRGPLVVRGRRPTPSAQTMRASQVVRRGDSPPVTRARVGILRYTRSTGHAHWHLLGFERYTLRKLGGGVVVRRDRKTGFCLGDRYDAYPSQRLPAEPNAGEWTDECGRNLPGLDSLEEGISVGYGDDYTPLLEGQYVDVTGVPAGRYELVHWVNPGRALKESGYANNASSVIIQLGWPQGHRAPPSVDVVRRCADGTRCLTAR